MADGWCLMLWEFDSLGAACVSTLSHYSSTAVQQYSSTVHGLDLPGKVDVFMICMIGMICVICMIGMICMMCMTCMICMM